MSEINLENKTKITFEILESKGLVRRVGTKPGFYICTPVYEVIFGPKEQVPRSQVFPVTLLDLKDVTVIGEEYYHRNKKLTPVKDYFSSVQNELKGRLSKDFSG